jgi:hypothetical protein
MRRTNNGKIMNYKEELCNLYEMYKNNAQSTEFFTYAAKIKNNLQKDYAELERIADTLDSLVTLYAPKRGWQTPLYETQEKIS